MKLLHLITYVLVLCFGGQMVLAQNKNLSTIPASVFINDDNTSIRDAITTDNHKTLLAAFNATDLEEILSDSGPFTIFAPSDIAFSRFSQSKLQAMLNSEDKHTLKSVLKYHIVPGKLTASKILIALCRGKGRTTFTTIQGNEITATMNGLDIILTDSMGNTARITAADSTGENGIMHEIDNVIIPSRI